ncbi:MAG: ECF transporter S component [Angustibacter sp.]
MSATNTADQDRQTVSKPPPVALLILGLGLLLAALCAVLGLPEASVAGQSLAALTAPASVTIALLAGWLAFSLSMKRPDWRVVDLVVASVLGVAGGLVFYLWNANYAVISGPLSALPIISLLGGMWLLPGVLGGLIVRRPGAALYTELVAAVVSGLLGSQWGFTVVYYGAIQGLGAEVIFAVLLYRRFGLGTAIGAGLGAAVAIAPIDLIGSYPDQALSWKITYVLCLMLSGAVIAGAGSWALTRALARSGALAPLASGQSANRV